MGTTVHYKPVDRSALWSMYVWQAAWDGNNVWNKNGAPNAEIVDFQLPDAPDARKLQFKFHATAPATGQTTWEADSFTRWLFLMSPAEVWTFESSPRVLYQNPFPAGVVFHPGDVLVFQAITQNMFRGGQLFVWNPYDSSVPPAYFAESARRRPWRLHFSRNIAPVDDRGLPSETDAACGPQPGSCMGAGREQSRVASRRWRLVVAEERPV